MRGPAFIAVAAGLCSPSERLQLAARLIGGHKAAAGEPRLLLADLRIAVELIDHVRSQISESIGLLEHEVAKTGDSGGDR